MKKIILFIPPAYDREFPPLGTPALIGFLKAHGIAARQKDLNVLYFNHIKNDMDRFFSKAYRDEKIKKRVYYQAILRYENSKPLVAYGFENNPGSSFAFTEKILSSRVLFRYLADEEENPFIRFFIEKVLPLIQKGSYRIVGFSITAPSQVIASLTFCCLLKKEMPEVKIVIGGQWVSLYREALRKRRDFLRLFDFIIYFEGETPLLRLLKALKGEGPLSEVPNLIHADGGRWQTTKFRTEEDLDRLPTPNFEGLPLKKYLKSKNGSTLPMETSRGCYWNKCIFCIDLPMPKPRYREKSPRLVIRDMKNLIERYGAKHLIISNATFSPWQMLEVAKKILAEKIKISWWTMARFDDGFDRETLKLAKEAGCGMIGFGLESINQRVLDFIEKGTKREIISRIMQDAHDLKLSIYFQAIIGLPSEKMEEALDTIEFLAARQGAAKGSAAFNTFHLIPDIEVFLHPEKYGIEIIPHERLPFRYFYPFRYKTGNVHKTTSVKLIRLYSDLITKKASTIGTGAGVAFASLHKRTMMS